MDLWLDFGMAWLAVVLAFILSVVYVLRVAGSKLPRDHKLPRLNKALRKHHKLIGLLLIAAGLVHGLFSSAVVWSWNLGTIAWIVTILLGVSWMVHKLLARRKWWMYAHRALTVVFIGLIVWHVLDVGGVKAFSLLFPPSYGRYAQDSPAESNAPVDITHIAAGDMSVPVAGAGEAAAPSPGASASAAETAGTLLMGGAYRDGTYEGSADGYRGQTTVSVTIKGNVITGVELVGSGDDPQFLYRAADTLTQEIMASQSTGVDTVSGATYSSVGIINAVNDALSKAILSGTLPVDQPLPAGRRH